MPTAPSADAPPPTGAALLDSDEAGATAVRGGLLRISGYGVGTLASIGSAAVLFRHLGVRASGEYVTVLSLVALAGGVTDAGLTSIGMREYAVREGRDRDETMSALLGMRIAFTLVGAVGAVLFAEVAGYDSRLVAGAAIAGVALVLQGIGAACTIGLMAGLRMGWVTSADVLRQVVTALAVVVLSSAGAGLVPFFATNIAGNAAALALIVVVARHTTPLRPALRPGAWRVLLSDTLPYVAATAVAALYFRLAIVLVSLLTNEDQTGYFGASFRGIEVLIVVPQLLVGAAFPIFARAAHLDRERLAHGIGRVFDVTFILGVGVGIGLVVGAPVVIGVVAGPGFEPAVDVLRVHALSLVISFAGAGWGYAALSLRLHRQVLWVAIAALLTSGALVSWLATAYGAQGAAVGTVLAELVMAGGLGCSVHRAGVLLSPDRRALPRVVLAAALGLAPAALTMVPVLPRTVLCLGTYAAALLLLRALPKELLEALPLPSWRR